MTTTPLTLSELPALRALDTIEAQAKTIAERDAEIERLREAQSQAARDVLAQGGRDDG